MRSYATPVLLFGFLLVLPSAAHAAIPFFGPIIPAQYALCAASWGLLITVINNIISLLITLAIFLVAPLTIAWAGFQMLVSQGNSGKITEARKMITNTIVGIIVALAAWLIVDAIMAVLYNPNAVGATWSQIINSGGVGPCIELASGLHQAVNSGYYAPGVTAGSVNAPPVGFAGSACDPAALQTAVPTLTNNQANLLGCLAQPESSCGSKMQNYSWNVGNAQGIASTAYGPFQVLLSSNHAAYENETCRQAAGVSGPLNCQNGFTSKGFTEGGNSTVLAYCMKAASNLACSASAAKFLLDSPGGANNWLADSKNSGQRNCVLQYGN